MSNGVIVIFEDDISYANHLMDYLNRKNDFLYQTIVFTKEDSFLEYCKSNRINMLLISEDIAYDLIPKENIKDIIILTKDQNKKGNIPYPFLYKFQSAELIMKEIKNHYSEQVKTLVANDLGTYRSNTKLIGVYSPSGDNMQTPFSLLLGQAYSDNKNTLYINLELFSALSILTGRADDGNLSDLIYYLKQENPNIILKLKTIIQKYNRLDYISCLENAFDLYEITKENMNHLMEQLKKNNNYEVVIVNIDYINHAVLEIFKACDLIYIIADDTAIAEKKVAQFERFLLLQNSNELYDKFNLIQIPYDENLNRGNYNSNYLENSMLSEFVSRLIGEGESSIQN